MKYSLLLFTVLLFGCTAATLPTMANESEWEAYGKKRAVDGYRVQSQQKLIELESQGEVSDSFYQAYLVGYEKGRDIYCDQNAYRLGQLGYTYHGICDDKDHYFRTDFNNGQRSIWYSRYY